MDIWIHQNKFHQLVMKKYFIKPLKKEEQTIRTFLTYYQEIACKAYPTEAKMEEALGNLYDSKFKVILTNYGTYSLYCYSLTAPDPAYIKDSAFTKEKLEEEFQKFMLPVFSKCQAEEELFLRAREIYESDLISSQEDLLGLSLEKLITKYFKKTDRDFSPLGTIEELKKITPRQVYQYYKELIAEEHISIGTGNYPSYQALQMSLQPKYQYTFLDRTNHSENFFFEKYPSNQSYLHILYETHIFSNEKLYDACRLLNYLIGGGSSSQLFKTIREKYGLCYLIHSTYFAASGILVISALTDAKKIQRTIQKIDEVINNLSKLDFEVELADAKQYFLGLHQLGKDFIDSKIQEYITDHYFPKMPKSRMDMRRIQAVTKEDILCALSLLEKSYTYVFGGKYEK